MAKETLDSPALEPIEKKQTSGSLNDYSGDQYKTIQWDMSAKGIKRQGPVKVPEAGGVATLEADEPGTAVEKGPDDAAKEQSPAERLAELEAQHSAAHQEASALTGKIDKLEAVGRKNLTTSQFIELARAIEKRNQVLSRVGDIEFDKAVANRYGVREPKGEEVVWATEEQARARMDAINKARRFRVDLAESRLKGAKSLRGEVDKRLKDLSEKYKENPTDPLFKAEVNELLDLRNFADEKEQEATRQAGLAREASELSELIDRQGRARRSAEAPATPEEEEALAETGSIKEVAAETAELAAELSAAEKNETAEKKNSPLFGRFLKRAGAFLSTVGKRLGRLFESKPVKTGDSKQPGARVATPGRANRLDPAIANAETVEIPRAGTPSSDTELAPESELYSEENPLGGMDRFGKSEDGIDGQVDLMDRLLERLAVIKSTEGREKVTTAAAQAMGRVQAGVQATERAIAGFKASPKAKEYEASGEIAAAEVESARWKEDLARARRRLGEAVAGSVERTSENPAIDENPLDRTSEIPSEIANAETQELSEEVAELQRETAELEKADPETAKAEKGLLARINGFARGIKARWLKGMVQPLRQAARYRRQEQEKDLAAANMFPGAAKSRPGEDLKTQAERRQRVRDRYDAAIAAGGDANARAGETMDISKELAAEMAGKRAQRLSQEARNAEADADEAELVRQLDKGSKTEGFTRNEEAAMAFNEKIANFIDTEFNDSWSDDEFAVRMDEFLGVKEFGDRTDAAEIAKVMNRVLLRIALNSKRAEPAREMILRFLENNRGYITTKVGKNGELQMDKLSDEPSQDLKSVIEKRRENN